MKNNSHKKRTFEDRFIKRWCCSAINHPEGWAWWKRRNRKQNRIKLKKELKEIEKDFT